MTGVAFATPVFYIWGLDDGMLRICDTLRSCPAAQTVVVGVAQTQGAEIFGRNWKKIELCQNLSYNVQDGFFLYQLRRWVYAATIFESECIRSSAGPFTFYISGILEHPGFLFRRKRQRTAVESGAGFSKPVLSRALHRCVSPGFRSPVQRHHGIH